MSQELEAFILQIISQDIYYQNSQKKITEKATYVKSGTRFITVSVFVLFMN